jgi:hypothetical protein
LILPASSGFLRSHDLNLDIPRSVKITRDESLCAVYISMSGGAADTAASGSGFLMEANGRYFLITNLHNLSGWDWTSNNSLSSRGWLPDTVNIELCFVNHKWGEATTYIYRSIAYDLFDGAGTPLWQIHPTFTESVDVAALPLGMKSDLISRCTDAIDLGTIPVNQIDWVSFSPAAGDDAMVLGYPRGMRGGGKFPVWKRASIAFEPDFDVDGQPKTMIDTATRKGMSGSLVIVVRRGLSIPDGATMAEGMLGESMKPLGVYSGRVGEDELGVQLGIVWKMSAVTEIIAGDVRGVGPLVGRSK